MLIAIVVANNSAGSLAQPAIAEAFQAGPADVGWVVFGFSATFAVATVLYGGIARRVGLGPSLALGVALFAVGSAAAVFAPNLLALIVARLVQGAGAGAIPTLSATLIARRFGGVDRARALGTTVGAVATGLAVGPLVGGLALELAGWQAVVAFGILAAPIIPNLFVTDRERDPRLRLDVRGAMLITLVALSATFVLNRAPVLGPGPVPLAAIAVLCLGAVALVRHSIDRPHAFLPGRILGAPAFRRVVFLGAVGMSAFLGSVALVPVAAARAHALSGVSLGIVLLPMAVAAAAASSQNARVQSRLGRRATTAAGLFALGGGAAVVGLMGAAAPPPLIATALAPVGAGFGLLGTPLLNELTVAFEGPDQPLAVGAYNLVFFLGGGTGAAIATALVQVGFELPPLSGRAVPGFSTAEILLAIAPLLAVLVLVRARPKAEVAGLG